MAITKKDVVILTVLFNIVVLACIIASARHERIACVTEEVVLPQPNVAAPQEHVSMDEIDALLEAYEDAHKEAESPSYYIVQDGDNPWKIAKKCHISFEKLLALNGLNETSAKNLRSGQKLKVKE